MSGQFGEEDHRKVWETWLETRNWTKTAELLNLSVYTIRRWADEDFTCNDGCQFHGFDGLLADLRRLRQSRNTLIADGNYNPVTQAETAIRTLDSDDAATRMDISTIRDNPSYQIFRKDEERIGHLELLWERMMYQMTGVPVMSREEMAKKGISTDDYDRMHAQDGLALRNMRDGVQSLQAVMNMMDAVRGRNTNAQIEKKVTSKLDSLSIEQLMKLKMLAETKPQIIIDATNVKTT